MKEFKIIKVHRSEFSGIIGDDFETVENLLAEKSQEGWDVVSVCPNEYIGNLAGGILITLQREKE